MAATAAGMRAMEQALARAYPGEPFTIEPGEGAPLERVDAHLAATPSPHWVYVGYGLTELHGKQPEGTYRPAGGDRPEPGRSGWGHELTFRVPATRAEPPTWPIRVLLLVAGYVRHTRNLLAPNHTMDLEGPLDPAAPDATLSAIAVARDPVLSTLETPNGRVEFLQVIGLTTDELDAAREWNVEGLLGLLGERHPMWAADATRATVLDDPRVRQRVEEAVARDGSSQLICYLECGWGCTEDLSKARLDLPLAAVSRLRRLLRGRALFGREFRLYAEEQGVVFLPGDAPGFCQPVSAVLEVTLDRELARIIEAELDEQNGPGVYSWDRLPGFFINVVADDGDGSA